MKTIWTVFIILVALVVAFLLFVGPPRTAEAPLTDAPVSGLRSAADVSLREKLNTLTWGSFALAGIGIESNRQIAPVETPEEQVPSAPDTSDAATEESSAETHVVRYTGGAYIPRETRVSVGQTVTWINEYENEFWPATDDHPTHTVYPGSNIVKCFGSEKETLFDACGALETRAEYSFTFNEAGEWGFHDHINPRVRGVVFVSP